jgi:CCR4-NOT transcription complex subunit 4
LTASSFGADLEELINMPDDELRVMIESAQRELDFSRKECDLVDKKLIGLVKRNKKLVQQAMAAALEFVTVLDREGM